MAQCFLAIIIIFQLNNRFLVVLATEGKSLRNETQYQVKENLKVQKTFKFK